MSQHSSPTGRRAQWLLSASDYEAAKPAIIERLKRTPPRAKDPSEGPEIPPTRVAPGSTKYQGLLEALEQAGIDTSGSLQMADFGQAPNLVSGIRITRSSGTKLLCTSWQLVVPINVAAVGDPTAEVVLASNGDEVLLAFTQRHAQAIVVKPHGRVFQVTIFSDDAAQISTATMKELADRLQTIQG